jgi:hypothetical protein
MCSYCSSLLWWLQKDYVNFLLDFSCKKNLVDGKLGYSLALTTEAKLLCLGQLSIVVVASRDTFFHRRHGPNNGQKRSLIKSLSFPKHHVRLSLNHPIHMIINWTFVGCWNIFHAFFFRHFQCFDTHKSLMERSWYCEKGNLYAIIFG